MAFQTQNSIKNEYCLERGRRQPWETTPQKKLGPGRGRSPLEKQLLMHSNQWENKIKIQLLRREKKKNWDFSFFFFRWRGHPKCSIPSASTSTGPFLLGVDFIPRQMDGRIRSSPHYVPLLRSLWIQSTKSILLTSAPVHTWHFLQFSRRHQKHQLAARKWEGANDRVR